MLNETEEQKGVLSCVVQEVNLFRSFQSKQNHKEFNYIVNTFTISLEATNNGSGMF